MIIFALQIVAVFALIGCGWLARKRGLISATGTRELARLTTDLIVPGLIFSSMMQLNSRDLWIHRGMPLLILGIALTGFLLGLIALRTLPGISAQRARAFLFHSTINNYLFLPLPLVLFLYGERGVAILVFSSIGYELVLWTLGVFLFTSKNGDDAVNTPDGDAGPDWRGMLSPPLITLMLSLLLIPIRDALAPHLPSSLQAAGDSLLFIARTLGQATVAFSVIVAGSRFATLRWQTIRGGMVWLVTGIRLILVPLVLIPIIQWLPLDPVAQGVATIICVMPSAMASVLFSERYGGDSEFIAGGLLLTHLWALLTVPLLLAWAL
jgi:malate permease and related proteins